MQRKTFDENHHATVRTGLALALVLFAATPVAGDEPVLTLEQAIAIAVEHNRELQAADARLGAAAAGLDEARAERLPRLGLSAAVQRTDHPVLVFSNLLGRQRFTAEDFALDRLNHPDPLSNWQTRVSVTQPLWTGGRIGHAVAAAELQRDAAGSGREATRQQVIHAVIEAHTWAALADRRLEVARGSLETARAHVEWVRDLWQGGLVVESDVLQAEVRVSEVEELAIRAESGVEIARAALNLALGRDLATPVALPAGVELGPPDSEIDLEALLATAGNQRPDLRAAHQLAGAAGRRVDLERAGRRPEIGLEAGWEADAADFFGADGDSWTVGVGLRLDLFDGHRRRARVRRADHRRREAEAWAALLAESVGLEVRRAASELAAAEKRLDQGDRAVALAERGLTIVEDRYREGLTVLTELLDAQDALTRARLRRLEARRDVALARASLDLATGNL
jgi:outer membrane protein TolC